MGKDGRNATSPLMAEEVGCQVQQLNISELNNVCLEPTLLFRGKFNQMRWGSSDPSSKNWKELGSIPNPSSFPVRD